MNKKYLLPTLNASEAVVCDDYFKKIDEAYDFLLDKLKLYYEPNVSVFDGGSNAMPHIYEQMILFNNAFFDNKNPEHERAVIEWQAVLAIMALQRVRNLKLEVIKADLSDKVSNPFLKAAASFRPVEKPVFYQTTWDFIYILCMNDTPIAIFSPLTIVCPAKMFKRRICSLDWIEIDKIDEKEALFFQFRGKGNEYANLGAWLRILEKKLICNDSSNSDVYNFYGKVMKELKKYIEKYAKEADQEINTLYKKGIYDSMNNSIRKEYDFLNYCCDFCLSDPKMNFLVERYRDDIFQQKILVFIYDDNPDAMFKKENIFKMDKLFHYVMEIDGRRIIQVIEPGGDRLAAYAFIPFKQNFVKELIEHDITADEFFEKYSVIYHQTEDTLEVQLEIRGFQYSFYKIFQHEDWQEVYKAELVPTYLWPRKKINALDWKHYYTYIYKDNSSISVDIPDAESSILYDPEMDGILGKGGFQLIKTKDYPAYIRYSYHSVGGYLPIKVNHIGMQDVGGKVFLFVDIGHTSTYVTMLKVFDENSGKIAERINFCLPTSMRITGEKDKSPKYNFIMSEDEQEKNFFNYFLNIVHSFYPYRRTPDNYSVNAFEDGQILFFNDFNSDFLENNAISFLDFDYDQMHQQQKRHAHIFIEQILIHAIYEAVFRQCSYMKVNFLHYCDEKNEKIGQLEGLWEHAMEIGKKWTGISALSTGSVQHMGEQEALTYYLYRKMFKHLQANMKTFSPDSEDIYIGVDIGWQKTLMTHIYLNDKKQFVSNYSKLSFGGYDISMVNSELNFQCYDEMLSILLTGSRKIDELSHEGKMIKKFKEIYQLSKGKCDNYYYGIFNLIAMEIEHNNFIVPPDVYNKMDEYQNFIKMMTYNILLLFLNIGYTLGNMRRNLRKKGKNIHVYLGGNGAKFLKWIFNNKDCNIINEENQYKVFIAETQEIGILDILKNGFNIGSSSTENLTCTINLVSEMKEQMIEGYIFGLMPNFFGYDGVLPQFIFQYVKNNFHEEEQSFQITVPKLPQREAAITISQEISRENMPVEDVDTREQSVISDNTDEETIRFNNVREEENASNGTDGEEMNTFLDSDASNHGMNGIAGELNENEANTSDNADLNQEVTQTADSDEEEIEKVKFYKEMYRLRKRLFMDQFKSSKDENQRLQKSNDIGEVIRTNTQNVCGDIIQVINGMRTNEIT